MKRLAWILTLGLLAAMVVYGLMRATPTVIAADAKPLRKLRCLRPSSRHPGVDLGSTGPRGDASLLATPRMPKHVRHDVKVFRRDPAKVSVRSREGAQCPCGWSCTDTKKGGLLAGAALDLSLRSAVIGGKPHDVEARRCAEVEAKERRYRPATRRPTRAPRRRSRCSWRRSARARATTPSSSARRAGSPRTGSCASTLRSKDR